MDCAECGEPIIGHLEPKCRAINRQVNYKDIVERFETRICNMEQFYVVKNKYVNQRKQEERLEEQKVLAEAMNTGQKTAQIVKSPKAQLWKGREI